MSMPPAGWYPSPDDPESQKYWDGSQWLDVPVPEPQNARRLPTKRTMVTVATIGALVVFAVIGGVAWKLIADKNEATQAALEEERAQELEAQRVAAEEKRVADEIAAQDKLDELLRQERRDSVVEIEASVKKMADGHAAEGMLTGPILSVTCSPIGGGSTDDLDQSTTVFDCFAANVDNGDGTMNGYKYHATMNWESGNYTYGLGSP